jgi:hypothetical protein
VKTVSKSFTESDGSVRRSDFGMISFLVSHDITIHAMIIIKLIGEGILNFFEI